MSDLVGPLPDVFLPYQKKLWQTILANQLTVVEKSRRTGFSWALGYIAASVAGAARSAGGQDVLYMGYEKDMTREFIDYVASAAKAFQIAASDVEEFVFADPERPEKAIGAFRIRFASGFEVIALPSVPRALRGKQGLVILDEAGFMDGLSEVLKAALALLIWGGRVVVVSTHDGETNPFNGLVNDVRGGRQKGVLLRLTFDDALEQGLYRRICFTRGIEWTLEKQIEWRGEILAIYRDNADEELHVIPNPTSGVYLPGTLIEARSDDAIPVLRYTAPQGMALWPEHVRRATVLDWCEAELLPVLSKLAPDEPHAFGEDFGRIRDLTVIWALAILSNTTRATRLVVELRGTPFEQQKDILFFIVDRLPRMRAGKMDAGGNGAYLAEVALQRYGTRIEEVRFSEAWYRTEMPPMKAAIEDGTFTLPRDRDVHTDLRSLKLIRGVARVSDRTRVDENASRHGDAAIAAALAYAASRAEPEVYAYDAVARPGTANDPDAWHDRAEDWDDDDRPAGRVGLPMLRGG
jgi:phage FluMu gp28-like protein